MPNVLPFPCENTIDDHRGSHDACALEKLLSKELQERRRRAHT